MTPPLLHIAVRQMAKDPVIDIAVLSDLLARAAEDWKLPVPKVTAFNSLQWDRRADGIITWSRRMPSGALGYHTTRKAGVAVAYCSPSPRTAVEVVYHEALEMLIDPDCNRFIIAPMLKGVPGFPTQVDFLVEICDPVERTVGAYIKPDFYNQPYLEPGGYISFVVNGRWYQCFSSLRGVITTRDLGAATARTMAERDRLLRKKK